MSDHHLADVVESSGGYAQAARSVAAARKFVPKPRTPPLDAIGIGRASEVVHEVVCSSARLHMCFPMMARDDAMHAIFTDKATMLPHLQALCAISESDMRERRERHRAEGISGRSLFLDIVTRDTGECIGTTGFRSISSSRAEWGCIIGRKWQRQGICTEAFAASVRHAATLHVKTVTASTTESNAPIRKALAKFGMVQTGCDAAHGVLYEAPVATLLATISTDVGSSSRSSSFFQRHPLDWQFALFGLVEPLVNIATTLLITADSPLFVRLLFAGAAASAPDAALGELAPTLTRMYASVLLCFGLTQAMLWLEWRRRPSESAHTVRTWMWLMLVPDCHHLFVAYGPYLLGPHGRLDAAFGAHYAIQGLLTIFRLVHLLSEEEGASSMRVKQK